MDEKSPPEAYVYLRNGLARLELTHPEVMGSEVRQFIMMHLKPELQWRGIEYDREFLYRTVISEVFEEIGLDEFWDLAQNLIEKTKQQYKDFLEE